jgi:hypothetical protein
MKNHLPLEDQMMKFESVSHEGMDEMIDHLETTMTSQHKPLRDALAAGPTAGPWSIGSNFRRIGDPMETFVATGLSPADVNYIAVANPTAIAALLADRDQLAAEVDALRVDAELLDWIACQDLQDLCMGIVIDAPNDGQHYVQSDGKPGYGPTLRAAIDAARARKE